MHVLVPIAAIPRGNWEIARVRGARDDVPDKYGIYRELTHVGCRA